MARRTVNDPIRTSRPRAEFARQQRFDRLLTWVDRWRDDQASRAITGVAPMIDDPVLNYVALGILALVVVVLFYGIIAIHDIPARIAESRHHPHVDAIHAAGWVSLF